TKTLTGTTAVVVNAAGIVPGTDVVTSTGNGPNGVPIAYVRDVDYSVDGTAGKLARIAGSAIPSGASVKIKYVAPPVTRSSLETITPPETARGRLVDILSSKRPDVPNVRAVVPTFQWTGGNAPPASLQSTRTGNSLRVYVDRPWFSS